jgi:uncharacterized LabA/DUF88 family protein
LARLAIFIDGGYYNALAEEHYKIRFEFSKFTEEIKNIVATKTPEAVELLRTYLYDCLPYQSKIPTPAESSKYGDKLGWFNYLKKLPRVEVRQGYLAFKGIDAAKKKPIFVQKMVDLLLGLDFAVQSSSGLITHLALVAGDGDLCPGVEFAKAQSVCVWLFHGPKVSLTTKECTYSERLWERCDERHEIDQAFVKKTKRI